MRLGLGCFVLLLSQLGFRNWQNWAVQVASWGSRLAGHVGSRIGARDQFTFSPQPYSGTPGAHWVQGAQFTQQLRPQGRPGEPQPVSSPEFLWEAPRQGQDGGCQCPAKPLAPFCPLPKILKPPQWFKQQGVLSTPSHPLCFLKKGAVSPPTEVSC